MFAIFFIVCTFHPPPVAVPADASVLQAARISLPALWAALSHLDCLSLATTLGLPTQRVHERMVAVMPALAADVAAAKTREQVRVSERVSFILYSLIL